MTAYRFIREHKNPYRVRETAPTAVPALHRAFTNRAAREGLLFHSGREVRCRAESFRARLQE